MIHVIPPYLHLLLGIVEKHHTLLENDCLKLDTLIADTLVKEQKVLSDVNISFTPAFKNHREQRIMIKQATDI